MNFTAVNSTLPNTTASATLYAGLSQEQLIQILIARDAELSQKDQQIATLEAIITALKQQLKKFSEQAEEALKKAWQLDEFTNMLFNKKSERFVQYSDVACKQPSLGSIFDSDDIEAVIAASRARTDSQKACADQQTGLSKPNRHHKKHIGRKGQKRRQYSVEEVITTVDYEGDKTGLKVFGKKVVQVFDYVPGKIVKSSTHYIKYINAEGEILKAPVTPRIIEKGRVSNRLVAHVQTEKFVYSMPYYRQRQKLRRIGADFAASTINGWEEICYRKLKRLLKLFKKIINAQDYLQIDEVPISFVNDVGKGKCSNGYFWVVNAPRQKLVLFEFNPSRGSAVPKDLLMDFSGTLQCDGLSSYKTAFKDNPYVKLLSCLAHIRRAFFKSLKNYEDLASHFLNETRIVYDIEAYCDHKGVSDEARVSIRQKHIRPILESMQKWMEENRGSVNPDSPMGKAFTYGLNHWKQLYHYLENGKLLPDNNGVERAIRQVTSYRKNSIFAGNDNGARRAALFFSLLETCKLNKIDPFEYLCDVYDRIHDCPANRLHELLPNQWKKSMPDQHPR